jgi:hypothetical protein
MARGTQIIVSTEPTGWFIEGIISGTPLPGSLMEMTTAAITAGQGRFTWQLYSGRGGTDAANELIAVLDADWDSGQIATTAYVTGTRGFIYAPEMAEELNMLVNDVAGTATAHTIGDYLEPAAATGRLKNSTGPTTGLMDCFQVLETVKAPLTAALVWCRYLGH